MSPLPKGEQNTRDSKTIEMMEHSQPVSRDTPSNVRDILLSADRFGTWFAETIRASGRVRGANRPDTRLLLTSAKISLKNVLLCRSYPHRHSCITQHFHQGNGGRADFAALHLIAPMTASFVRVQGGRSHRRLKVSREHFLNLYTFLSGGCSLP